MPVKSNGCGAGGTRRGLLGHPFLEAVPSDIYSRRQTLVILIRRLRANEASAPTLRSFGSHKASPGHRRGFLPDLAARPGAVGSVTPKPSNEWNRTIMAQDRSANFLALVLAPEMLPKE